MLQARNASLLQENIGLIRSRNSLRQVVELRQGSEPSRGVEAVPPPPPIVPPNKAVLEVSLALTNLRQRVCVESYGPSARDAALARAVAARPTVAAQPTVAVPSDVQDLAASLSSSHAARTPDRPRLDPRPAATTPAQADAGDNATRAPKRQRLNKFAPPRVDERCPICLEDVGEGVTLDCKHMIHASCLEEYCANVWAGGTAATRTRRGTQLTCPICRAPSRIASSGFKVGQAVEAKWDGAWHPGVVDEVLSDEGTYEIVWDDAGQCNPIPARDVRARAT